MSPVTTVASWTCSVCEATKTTDGPMPRFWADDPYNLNLNYFGAPPPTVYCDECLTAARAGHKAALDARRP